MQTKGHEVGGISIQMVQGGFNRHLSPKTTNRLLSKVKSKC
jgi:hypothetical protein